MSHHSVLISRLFFKLFDSRLAWPRIVLSFLCTLFLSKAVFAADIVVDNKNAATTPQLTRTDGGVPQINIVAPENGLSHNRFEQYNVDAKGVVINNSRLGDNAKDLELIGANENLKTAAAKTILFEVTGASRSELNGISTVVGEQANFILANPNGITCDGCGFINTHDVELRTDRLHSVTNGRANWKQDLNGDIHIGKGGATVRDGALTLSSGKIKIEGAISVKELLRAEAHFAKAAGSKAGTTDAENANEKYAIDISTVAPITAGKVYLVATGEGAGVKISTPKVLLNEAEAKSQAIITSKEDINIEAKGRVDIAGSFYSAKNLNVRAADFNIDTPLEIDGDFKFVGRNFKNQNTFKAGNIQLNLSGDFVNEANGSIAAKDGWYLASKGFTNYQKMDMGKAFKVKSDYFVNDQGGNIGAGSIEIKLIGKMYDGNSLSQRSNSVLESREGGIELIAPEGGMYFGYKKEPTGAGDNKDGFKFIGNKLLSRGGPIHIQSGGDVVFEGTQIVGDAVVEARGGVKENNLIGSYRNGVDNIKKVENKVRIVTTAEPRTRIIPRRIGAVRTVMKTEQYTVKGFVQRYGPSDEGHCCTYPVDITRTREVPVQEYYTQDSPIEQAYTEMVHRQESYTEETIIQEPHFQGVALMTNFAGNKQIAANKVDLMFKETAFDKFEATTQQYDDYLKFVVSSDPVATHRYREEL